MVIPVNTIMDIRIEGQHTAVVRSIVQAIMNGLAIVRDKNVPTYVDLIPIALLYIYKIIIENKKKTMKILYVNMISIIK